MNDAFHDAYDEKRHELRTTDPVFIVLANSLIVHAGGARREASVSSEAFHQVKSVAHVPVAAYAALYEQQTGPIAEPLQGRLRLLQTHIERLLSELGSRSDSWGQATTSEAELVLEATRRLVGNAIERGAPGADALSNFGSQVRASLMALTRQATIMQVETLHDAVERELERLASPERGRLQVIVAGEHQARARSLPMQYFQKRLGEKPGEEKRVAFAEGATSEEKALELVGTRQIDFAIAGAFFGDESRLQRDVLGDAARDALDQREFAPIGE